MLLSSWTWVEVTDTVNAFLQISSLTKLSSCKSLRVHFPFSVLPLRTECCVPVGCLSHGMMYKRVNLVWKYKLSTCKQEPLPIILEAESIMKQLDIV